MFEVKATVIDVLGDESKYPCHFKYKIGDEIIWNGAELKGRICPAILGALSQKMQILYTAGARYKEPGYYHTFWYVPPSVHDESMKKYDGLGFKPVLKTIPDEKYSMTKLRPANSFKWPPHPERTVMDNVTLTCPDLRTAILFKFDVIDLADDGDSKTYFRRHMCIIHRIQDKPDIPVSEIINLFTKEEQLEIYPPLTPMVIELMIEDQELVGLVSVTDGKVNVTDKGRGRLEKFRKTLSHHELEALKL
jgi:uncharacterized repeat protein (TIGR04076 family)